MAALGCCGECDRVAGPAVAGTLSLLRWISKTVFASSSQGCKDGDRCHMAHRLVRRPGQLEGDVHSQPLVGLALVSLSQGCTRSGLVQKAGLCVEVPEQRNDERKIGMVITWISFENRPSLANLTRCYGLSKLQKYCQPDARCKCPGEQGSPPARLAHNTPQVGPSGRKVTGLGTNDAPRRFATQ